MKNLILLCLLMLCSNVYAESELTIFCERPGINTSNQFDMVGMATLDDEGNFKTNGVFTVVLRRQGRDSNEISKLLEFNGFVKRYAAGSLALKEVIKLTYHQKDSEIEYVNILGNHPDALSSTIRTKDGVEYKSQCVID